MIVAARPKLKATIKRQPESDAVERDRREQHDERGRARKQARGDADTEDALRPHAGVVMVVMTVAVAMSVDVVVVMAVTVAWPRPRSAPAGPPHRRPTTSSPETSVSHGIELLRNDELRERERDDADREDAGRVRDRDRASEQERVTRPAPRPDEVGRDERLAMTRRECVGGAPEGGDEEGQEQHTSETSPCSISASKPPASCSTAACAVDRGWRSGPSPGVKVAAALDTSSGERSRSFGYARSAAALALGGTSDVDEALRRLARRS